MTISAEKWRSEIVLLPYFTAFELFLAIMLL